jgi:carbon monoxide dehydrogenase subunit G
MQFEGSVEIAASRQAVWAFLLDFDRVAACGPGVESVEKTDDGHARVDARIGVGFISARFSIDLELGEVVAPDRAEILGRGDAPGTQVEGRAAMRLSGPEAGPTTLDWTADVEIFGSLAAVGARLIESTANRLIDDAFDCIRAKLAAPAAG